MTLNMGARKIFLFLLSIIIILTLISIITQAIRFLYLNPEIYKLSRFNLDAEANIPTYFATLILLSASVLLSIIASRKKQELDLYRIHWKFLSFIFFVLALDEAAAIHEMLINPVKTLLNLGGFFYYAWIIPALIFLVVFAIIYIKFYLHLKIEFKILFGFSAFLYVIGAVGLEGASGLYRELSGNINFTYNLITTIEEVCELMGSSLFIYTLLRYLSSYYKHIKIDINFN